MTNRVEGVRVAHPLFQVEGGGASPTSTLSLWFSEAHLKTAKALNALWHSRLPKFARPTCRVAYTAECEANGLYYAAAIWTNPLARMLPQLEWLELNRLAIAPDAPKNTASRMLAWMARDIRKRLPAVCRLISYQDCDIHTGGIYRAAGWVATECGTGGEWNSSSKPRAKVLCGGPKQRWEKVLYERLEANDTAAESTGAGAGLHLPGRANTNAQERDALSRPSLWESPVDDG